MSWLSVALGLSKNVFSRDCLIFKIMCINLLFDTGTKDQTSRPENERSMKVF